MSTRPPVIEQACASPRDACIVVSEFPLNHHQSFRAEIVMRAGKPMVSISRLKITPDGARRTGQAFEFGAHRTAAIASLLSEVLRALGTAGESAKPEEAIRSQANRGRAKRSGTECSP